MEPIGENLRRLRTLAGLTQEALAEKSGLALITIQNIEQQRPGRTPSVPTLSTLAAALGVRTGALFGDVSHAVNDRDPAAATIGLVGMRRALTPVTGLDGTPLDVDPAGPPPTAASTTAAVIDANRRYHGDDYATVLAGLPGLLGTTRTLVDITTGDEKATAHTVASRAHALAGRLLIQLREVDLAQIALDAAMRHARAAGDPIVGAEAVAAMCWLLLRGARFGDAKRLALATAEQVEPKLSTAGPAELSAWGYLLVKAASAAVRDADRDEATDILDLASVVAGRLGDRPSPHAAVAGNDFSAEGVRNIRTECAVIADQPDRALTIAQDTTRSVQVTPSSRQRHRLDVAWAHLQTGQPGNAVDVLLDLRRTAPSWLRHQPYARDVVTGIADAQRRTVGKQLATLAAAVGLTEPLHTV